MVDPSNPRVGILIDLDLAAIVKDKDGNDIDVKPILTGTVPYLAVDLLQDDPPSKCYYRHDLESFFYVLVWIASHFDRGEYVDSGSFNVWQNQSWSDIAFYKIGFASSYTSGYTTSFYRPLEKSWLPRLSTIFMHGFRAWQRHIAKALNTEDFDFGTLGGHITYQHFVDILRR